MTIDQRMAQAIAASGYEYGRPPIPAYAGIDYISWRLQRGQMPLHASNRPQRIRCELTVELYTGEALTGGEILKLAAVLAGAGFRVTEWGPELYYTDMRWHYLPIRCQIDTMIEEEIAND